MQDTSRENCMRKFRNGNSFFTPLFCKPTTAKQRQQKLKTLNFPS